MTMPPRASLLAVSLLALAGPLAGPLAAQTPAEAVPVEGAVLGASTIRLHLHPFLAPDELAMLRLVLTNEQALAIFVPQTDGATGGHAALAAAPAEGVVRAGQPVASAIALAGLPDALAADEAARAACDAARDPAGAACVTVLSIAPAP